MQNNSQMKTYMDEFHRVCEHSSVVPIIIKPREVLFKLLQSQNFDDFSDDLKQYVIKQELIIQQQNEQSMLFIDQICKLIIKVMEQNPKDQKQIVKSKVLEQLPFQDLYHIQGEREKLYKESFTKIAKLLIDQGYRMIELSVIELIQREIKCENVHQYITDMIEQSMAVIAVEMKNFALIKSDELYWNIKQYFNQIMQNIHYFVHKASMFCNDQMEELNELLVKYGTLANLRTYQILQYEESVFIIEGVHKLLRNYYFFRQEIEIFEKPIVNQTIRYFYEYSKIEQGPYKLSTLTTSFQQALELNGLSDSQFDFLNLKNHNEKLNQDDYLKYKAWLKQKRQLQAQQMLTKGALGGAVAGGSIGAGIGCLIVDSADQTIPWEQKIKRAGFMTMQTGLVGAALRIPVVGILLQQAIIIYAVHYTMTNKVVSNDIKAKNMAHLGAQTTVGLGSAIAGQILIPVPILGAMIGGTIGGVAIGLYQKFIVPKTKPMITKLLQDISDRIMPNGLVIYDDEVPKLLKINKNHFYGTKPDQFQESEWLTILSVYTVNEMHYLIHIKTEEAEKLLEEKKIKTPKKAEKYDKQLKEAHKYQEQMEILNVKWERSRIYITEKDIRTLPYAPSIGEFINGLIQNFRV